MYLDPSPKENAMYLDPSPRSPVIYHEQPVNDFIVERELFIQDPLIASLYLARHLPAGAVIAGGYLTSLVFRAMHGDEALREVSKDLDIFFYDGEAIQKTRRLLALAGYEKVTSGKVPWNCENWKPVQELGNPTVIQLVKKTCFANAEQVIDSFDFTACQLAIEGNKLLVGPQTLADIAGKRLSFHRVKTDQKHNRERVFKYMAKGYRPTFETLENLRLDLTDELIVSKGDANAEAVPALPLPL